MGRNRWAGEWGHHREWIRDVVLHGTPYAQAAAVYGYSRATAWRVLQLPAVKRYVSSLRRWQSDRALQARIERDIHAVDVVDDDQSSE